MDAEKQRGMEHLHLINARVPGYAGLQVVQIQHDVIATIEPMHTASVNEKNSLDLAGDWISLGGVDLQINGVLGLAFPDLTLDHAEKIATIAQFLWEQGIDAFLPTIVTTSIENIQRSLQTILAFQTQNSKLKTQNSATILGVHLEGPFLNPEKRGAHPAEYLLDLTLENVKRILDENASVVKIITLAPELDRTGEVIPYLRSLGITVSLGHSQATAAQAQQAFEQGASLVTHAFNAMPGLHHREPGLLGAAIVDPQVYCGLIADGQHVVPLMADLLLRASHYEQGIFLVSDALSPLGLPDGVYPWDCRQIEVKQGTARLPDGTLAGTTLPLLVGVQNLVNWGICSVEQAIALATTAPRRAIGLPSSYLGQPAHLLRWHCDPDTGMLTWQRLTN
jgi:N-acetylglucosamine-6-phosphate deacetylase